MGIDWRTLPEVVWRALVFIIAIGILIIVTTRWNRWQGAAGWQSTDDAYLQADITPIAARVSGHLRTAPVDDYQRVGAGQLIAQIDDQDCRVTVAQAQASVASAQAQADALAAQRVLQGANVEAANAVVTGVAAALAQNTRDLARQQRLLTAGSSTIETSEKLQTGRDQLTAQLAQTRAQADAAAMQLAVLAAQEAQARAAIAGQQASLRLARINLGYTTIVAPRDGVIGQRQVRPGQLVGVGGQITTLMPLPHMWVIANYKKRQLTHMAVGEKAEIRVDAFPGHVLRCHVLALAPGSGRPASVLWRHFGGLGNDGLGAPHDDQGFDLIASAA